MTIDPKTLTPKVRRLIAAHDKWKADTREYLAEYDANQAYRLERDLVRDALAMLAEMGVFCWRNNTGSAGKGGKFVRFGLKGSADIIGVLPGGKFLAIECKARGKQPTLEQEAFLNRISQSGGIAGVCWTLQDVKQLIEKG